DHTVAIELAPTLDRAICLRKKALRRRVTVFLLPSIEAGLPLAVAQGHPPNGRIHLNHGNQQDKYNDQCSNQLGRHVPLHRFTARTAAGIICIGNRTRGGLQAPVYLPLPLSLSFSVITFAMAWRTISTFTTGSSLMRSTTLFSLMPMTVPYMPPLVSTRSPLLTALSIACRSFSRFCCGR